MKKTLCLIALLCGTGLLDVRGQEPAELPPVVAPPEPLDPVTVPLPEPLLPPDLLLPPREALPDAGPDSALLPPAGEPPAPFVPLPPAVPRVAVVDPSVALDGTARPELARAVADALVSVFLGSGAVEVIDVTGRTVADLTRPGAGEPACDTIFVPTLVGHSGEYKMTVRRIAVPSGKIEQLYEDTARGSMAGLMEMTARVGRKLLPPTPAVAPRPAPEPVRAGRIRAWMSAPETPPPAPPRPAAPKPAARPAPQPATPSRPLRTIVLDGQRQVELEQVGRLTSFNRQYSFCVISPTSTTGRRLQVGDRLLIQVDNFRRPTIAATVRRLESSQVIADYETEGEPPLAAGAAVYQWMPAEKTAPTPGLPSVPELPPRRR